MRRTLMPGAGLCGGNAAVEFGLLAPMLLILLTGIVEIGMAGYQSMQVQAAAEAGALYASIHGAASLTAVANAVVSATDTVGITATPAPTTFCGCPGAAGVVAQGTDCTTKCSDGTLPGSYVSVSASVTHTPIMPFLNLPIATTLVGRSTVRVQ
jgi:Flp pilus assembly protein TadG